LTLKEKRHVKDIAGQLLATPKHEKLVLDWRKHQTSRAAVQVLIQDMVWRLPEVYSDTACQEKSAAVYQHVYDSYWGAGQSVYAIAG
jgi:type I restriction enzyme R subunit